MERSLTRYVLQERGIRNRILKKGELKGKGQEKRGQEKRVLETVGSGGAFR